MGPGRRGDRYNGWFPARISVGRAREPDVKYYLIYEHNTFDGPTARPTDNTAVFRVQLAF